MTTLIELEEPFRSKWRKGYLQKHPNGRQYVHLYNNDRERSLISFARYLLCVKEGKMLDSNLDADHVDNDPANDSTCNVQSLSKLDNIRKGHIAHRGFIQKDLDQRCVICCGVFRNIRSKATCGNKSCLSEHLKQTALKFNIRPPTNSNGYTDVQKSNVLELSRDKKSVYAISKMTGVSEYLVKKIIQTTPL